MSCGTPATWERSSRVADATRLRVTLEYHLMRAHTSPPFVRIGVELSYRNVNQGIWLKRRQLRCRTLTAAVLTSPRSRVALSNSQPALKLFGCALVERRTPAFVPAIKHIRCRSFHAFPQQTGGQNAIGGPYIQADPDTDDKRGRTENPKCLGMLGLVT